ncbi:hypothetical protein DPMN_149690 [Dreissena polymorpha]|uniref:Uncharacterized protein n=1 Tax=Dreissena polymorpha TaxID=45954 RepID=A0A9D4FEW3_DREPO|nr:hypothetical protein DPMN_149690 [Dreissena polymorpha]
MLWFSKRRIVLEMLGLEMRNRVVQCRNENGEVDESDAILQEMSRLQEVILMDMRQRMLVLGCAADYSLAFLHRILM